MAAITRLGLLGYGTGLNGSFARGSVAPPPPPPPPVVEVVQPSGGAFIRHQLRRRAVELEALAELWLRVGVDAELEVEHKVEAPPLFVPPAIAPPAEPRPEIKPAQRKHTARAQVELTTAGEFTVSARAISSAAHPLAARVECFIEAEAAGEGSVTPALISEDVLVALAVAFSEEEEDESWKR